MPAVVLSSGNRWTDEEGADPRGVSVVGPQMQVPLGCQPRGHGTFTSSYNPALLRAQTPRIPCRPARGVLKRRRYRRPVLQVHRCVLPGDTCVFLEPHPILGCLGKGRGEGPVSKR